MSNGLKAFGATMLLGAISVPIVGGAIFGKTSVTFGSSAAAQIWNQLLTTPLVPSLCTLLSISSSIALYVGAKSDDSRIGFLSFAVNMIIGTGMLLIPELAMSHIQKAAAGTILSGIEPQFMWLAAYGTAILLSATAAAAIITDEKTAIDKIIKESGRDIEKL